MLSRYDNNFDFVMVPNLRLFNFNSINFVSNFFHAPYTIYLIQLKIEWTISSFLLMNYRQWFLAKLVIVKIRYVFFKV